MTLPPWRDAAAMLSKWQPRRSINMDLDTDEASIASPAAAAGAAGSPNVAPNHARRHSSCRASPRAVAGGGGIAAGSAGLGTRSASQVTGAGGSCPDGLGDGAGMHSQNLSPKTYACLLLNAQLVLETACRRCVGLGEHVLVVRQQALTASVFQTCFPGPIYNPQRNAQVTEDTNGPRPSKTQRLGGAAAAVAARAALGLYGGGNGVPQHRGRPPTSRAALAPAVTAPVIGAAPPAARWQPALRDTQSEADAVEEVQIPLVSDGAWEEGDQPWSGLPGNGDGGLRGSSPEASTH